MCFRRAKLELMDAAWPTFTNTLQKGRHGLTSDTNCCVLVSKKKQKTILQIIIANFAYPHLQNCFLNFGCTQIYCNGKVREASERASLNRICFNILIIRNKQKTTVATKLQKRCNKLIYSNLGCVRMSHRLVEAVELSRQKVLLTAKLAINCSKSVCFSKL